MLRDATGSRRIRGKFARKAWRPPHVTNGVRRSTILSLPDSPTYSAVRGLLRVLEYRGCIRHEQDGTRYVDVYLPIEPGAEAAHSASALIVRTFFGRSVEEAVATLVT